MNSATRRKIRQTLLDVGYERVMATQDHGNGQYVEVFVRPGIPRVGDGSSTKDDVVNLSWGPRTDEPMGPAPTDADLAIHEHHLRGGLIPGGKCNVCSSEPWVPPAVVTGPHDLDGRWL